FFASAGTNWANVSRTRAWAVASAEVMAGAGGATTGAATWAVTAGGGTTVGRLVSYTTRSGSFWSERMRTTVLLTEGAAWLATTACCGTSASMANSSASSTPPTNRK